MRRSRSITYFAFSLISLSIAVLPTAIPPRAEAADDIVRDYTDADGTMEYHIHLPPGDPAGKPMIVWLHGCGRGPGLSEQETRDPNDDWVVNRVADEFGAVLVRPIRRYGPDTLCWDWLSPANQQRGHGDPARLANLTTAIVAEFGLDRSRVYMSGYSAGGAMATVMGATYPDLYAAIAPMAGAPFRIDPTTAFESLTGTVIPGSGQPIHDAMGARARPLPTFFLQAPGDQLSLYSVGRADLEQWLSADNIAYRGSDDGTVPRLPASNETVGPGPGFMVAAGDEHYSTHGCEIAEFVSPTELEHFQTLGLLSSDDGIGYVRMMIGFLLAHSLDSCR
ncbi:alpha/beta hydrolase family esterase [Nocardia sp. NPDC059240]|uniref:alpha/beta hydrolase family esterase n=1 Tax=Nocardia sp. NPDC059240 TaxID=3346786 RepID=UPI0036B2C42D